MKTKGIKMDSKSGLILGFIIFLLMAFGTGIAFWVFNQGTDNRSQASADEVARFKLTDQNQQNSQPGVNQPKLLRSYALALDTSQLKSGATVSEFGVTILITKSKASQDSKVRVLGETTLVKSAPNLELTGPPKRPEITNGPAKVIISTCRSNSDCPSGFNCIKASMTACPTGAVCNTVMAESGTCAIGKVMLPTPTIIRPTLFPTATAMPIAKPLNILAQSKDGMVILRGTGAQSQITNLKTTLDLVADGYQLNISGQTDSKNMELQKLFSKSENLFQIEINGKSEYALITPLIQQSLIRGFLPGISTAVDLTQSLKPTSPPKIIQISPVRETPKVSSVPPRIVPSESNQLNCKTSLNCPKGYACMPATGKCIKISISSPTRVISPTMTRKRPFGI